MCHYKKLHSVPTTLLQDASKSMIELPVKQESVASGQKRSNPDSGSQDPVGFAHFSNM